FYHPVEFTFNFHKGLRYPGVILGEYWDINTIRKKLKSYYNYSRKWNVPIFAGEFGMNSRCQGCGETCAISQLPNPVVANIFSKHFRIAPACG
ncbi:MAG: hypothetical protein KKC71_02785, partial [Chloroflexi bacterium]|nr:hypothetical protein [Chloroflexota bacterium]